MAHISPKLKKKLQLAKNKRNQMIFKHAEFHADEHARIMDDDEERRKPSKEIDTEGAEVWSAKTQEIKDKLRRKKRKSKDRWNRFAGTSDGGGRGR